MKKWEDDDLEYYYDNHDNFLYYKEKGKRSQKMSKIQGLIAENDWKGIISAIFFAGFNFFVMAWSLWSIMFGQASFWAQMSVISIPIISTLCYELTGRKIRSISIANTNELVEQAAKYQKTIDAQKETIDNILKEKYDYKIRLAKYEKCE